MVVHTWGRTSHRAPTALPSSAAAGRDKTEPWQQLASGSVLEAFRHPHPHPVGRGRTRANSSPNRTGTAPAMKICRSFPGLGLMASALGSPQHSSFLDFGAVAVLGPRQLDWSYWSPKPKPLNP